MVKGMLAGYLLAGIIRWFLMTQYSLYIVSLNNNVLCKQFKWNEIL